MNNTSFLLMCLGGLLAILSYSSFKRYIFKGAKLNREIGGLLATLSTASLSASALFYNKCAYSKTFLILLFVTIIIALFTLTEIIYKLKSRQAQ